MTQVQILDEADCISVCVYILGKRFYLSPSSTRQDLTQGLFFYRGYIGEGMIGPKFQFMPC